MMAQPLKSRSTMPMRLLLQRGALGGLLACTLAAGAGPLADPTRPPSSQRGGDNPGAAKAQPGGRPAKPALPAAAVEPPPPLPTLQSLQMPSQGAPLALVDGQLVKVGDSVAGWVVLSIDNQGLVLRGAAGNERLSLLGGTPKQAAGSIQTTRSARYEPATPAPSPLATDPTPSNRTERTAQGDQASALQARPATTGPLSLAGKTSP